MKRNHLIVLVLCCVVAAMVAGAFFIGPPRPDSGSATTVMTPSPAQPASSVSGRIETAGSSAIGAGLSVSSFGPVPGCSDAVAIDTVVALLRKNVAERVLGLANVQILGHSQVGDLVQWDCGGAVQLGDRQQRVRYQISQEVAGRESWQVNIKGPVSSTP